MASKEDSTGGTTPETEKAVQAVTGVGGVRRSEDAVPDLWSGERAGERRDATCSAVRRAGKDVVTAREGYQRPKKSGNCKSRCLGELRLDDKGTRKAGCGKTACPV